MRKVSINARRWLGKWLRRTSRKPGARFENGCLSLPTGEDLIVVCDDLAAVEKQSASHLLTVAAVVEADFFQDAKQEVLHDIWMNPAFRDMITNCSSEENETEEEEEPQSPTLFRICPRR